MNRSLLKSLYLFLLMSLAYPAQSQDVLVEHTYLGSRTKFELLVLFGQLVDYDIDLYKIRYKTADVNGDLDTASGLMVLPQVPANTELPIVVYNHGTTSGPTDVPSQLRGGFEVAMAYGGFGFATLAPDYIGLGDARGFHPYLHAATEASASLDMLFAGYEYLEFNDPDLDPNFLFLAGYSQGGHAAMALHKEIDDFWSIIIPVTAATHMSGPYSMSEVMRERVLSDESYGFPSYIAYLFLSYNEAYDLYADVGEVFKEPYASDVDSFYNRQINLTTLNGRLITALAAGGDTIVKRMLQDSIVDALQNNPDHPLNIALEQNDTYNFAPEAPTRLYYCGNDQQVPPRNSIKADSVMNALGAPDTEAIDLNPNFDHGPCVFPAVLSSIDFFLSFVNPSSVDKINPDAEELSVYPNPFFNEIIVNWDKANDGLEYEVYYSSGQLVRQGHTATNRITMEQLPSGVYMLLCRAGDETRMARIMHR